MTNRIKNLVLKLKNFAKIFTDNKKFFAGIFMIILHFSLLIYLYIDLKSIWNIIAICPFPEPRGRFKHIFNAWAWWIEYRFPCYWFHPKINTVLKFTVSWPTLFVLSYNAWFIYTYYYWYVFVHKSKIKYIFWFMVFWITTVLIFSFFMYIDIFISVYISDRRILWMIAFLVYVVIWTVIYDENKKKPS